MSEYLEIDNPEDFATHNPKSFLAHNPKEFVEKTYCNRCVFYSTCVMVACILFGLVVVAATLGNDAQILITDAARSLDNMQRTLHEVDELIPQVHRLIGIVEQLCGNPTFHLNCPT